MTQNISFENFNKIYQQKVKEVFSFWKDEMQSEIAKHNIGWASPYSFQNYLELSAKRYYFFVSQLKSKEVTICDIGGFWGALPLALNELGFKVSTTETLKYYSSAFDDLFNHIKAKGVEIIDFDPFNEVYSSEIKFDYVTLFAVVEHYPHSLKPLFENIHLMLKSKGELYIEVPNIAYIYKRFQLLKGVSPLPHISVVYKSATPFTGHQHEYSMEELEWLFNNNDFQISNKFYYNYSFDYNNLKYVLGNPVKALSQILIPDTREVISMIGKRKI